MVTALGRALRNAHGITDHLRRAGFHFGFHRIHAQPVAARELRFLIVAACELWRLRGIQEEVQNLGTHAHFGAGAIGQAQSAGLRGRAGGTEFQPHRRKAQSELGRQGGRGQTQQQCREGIYGAFRL